jgi:hypothetical protein
MRKLLILLAACALVVAFTLPAAADVSFYGQTNMTTGYTTRSEEVTGNDSDTDIDVHFDTPVLTQFGAKFQNGDVGGQVEIRPSWGETGVGTANYMRLWYGSWNFGAGTLIVGQAYTPTCVPAHSDLYKTGITPWYGSMVGSVRQPQIGLHIGSFKLAIMKPEKSAVAGGVDQDVTLPHLEANYSLKAGPASITLLGMYQTFDDILANDDSYDVTSMLIGATVRAGFGAVNLAFNIWTGKNLADGGLGMPGYHAAAYDAADDEIDDVSILGYGGSLTYMLSETMKVSGGYFGISQDRDDFDEADGSSVVYVNLPITLAKGVMVAPEIRMINYMEDTAGEDEGSETSYGIYWAINY